MSKHWLSLHEAAEMIGKRRYTDWSFDKYEADKAFRERFRRELYDMFQSGQVETYAHSGDGVSRRQLGIPDFRDPCFGLLIDKNRAHVGTEFHSGGNEFQLEISKAGILAYFKMEVGREGDVVDYAALIKILDGHKYCMETLRLWQKNGGFPEKRMNGGVPFWPKEAVIAWWAERKRRGRSHSKALSEAQNLKPRITINKKS